MQIARFPEVITMVEEEDKVDEMWEELKPLISASLDMMIGMREVEGNKLKEDILVKVKQIEELVVKVEEFADSIPKAFKQKLEDRLKELLGAVEVDENRVATEVCILADKATVDEEIIRLKSHINQVRETLKLNEPIGRKLDFIVQEMNRETNTIGSKSSDIQMTNIVIDIKNILEKIREQVGIKLINIGFGNIVSANRLVAIVSPESAPIKRIIQEARDRGMLIDATYGRRTRAVIITDSDHVILSAVQPETVAHRLVVKDEAVDEVDE